MLPLLLLVFVVVGAYGGAYINFLEPLEDSVTQEPACIKFAVHNPTSDRVIFQIDGGDQGILCEQSEMTITLNDLKPGHHTVSVTIQGLPPAVLSFWHISRNVNNHVKNDPASRLDVDTWSDSRLDYIPRSPADKPLVTIKVLTMNRNNSLYRLLASLNNASYDGDKVDLDIFVDYRCAL